MNLDDLKSMYQQAGYTGISRHQLSQMLGKHPSLKQIKRQLAIESVLWSAFLVVYYDIFDGHLKPLGWNIALMLAVLLVLVHNLLSYRITHNPMRGASIQESLKQYLVTIRRYAALSIGSRGLAFLAVMAFFLSASTFTSDTYGPLAGIMLILCLQLYGLWRVWRYRIHRIQEATRAFADE